MYEKSTGANDLIRAQILLAHSVSPLRTVKIFKANLRCARLRRETIAVVVCATWRPLRAGRRQAYLAEKFLIGPGPGSLSIILSGCYAHWPIWHPN